MLKNIEYLRKLRNIEREKLRNPNYEKKQQKQKQNALHSTLNHSVNNFKKTVFQQSVLNVLRPITYENKKTKKLIYKSQQTINRIYTILTYILMYGSPSEVRQILQLREFVRNSANTRQKRNSSKKLHYDSQKQGHNIARRFEYDRLRVFNNIFPETSRLFF